MLAVARVHLPGWSASELRSRSRMITHSSGSSSDGDGTPPACSYSAPLCTNKVASPPSSRIMFGPSPSGQVSASSAHRQYSSRVSPFQAKTGMPFGSSGVPSGPTATAAAAWSWVEKMLQLAQRTCAPSAVSVSISTAVWIVMCRLPVILAPRRGLLGELDFLAPEGSKREVGNLVRKLIRGHAFSPYGWLVLVSAPRYGTTGGRRTFSGTFLTQKC